MAINTLFQNIADAIRERGGTSAALTPAQMPQAIAAIPTGGNLLYGLAAPTSSIGSNEDIYLQGGGLYDGKIDSGLGWYSTIGAICDNTDTVAVIGGRLYYKDNTTPALAVVNNPTGYWQVLYASTDPEGCANRTNVGGANTWTKSYTINGITWYFSPGSYGMSGTPSIISGYPIIRDDQYTFNTQANAEAFLNAMGVVTSMPSDYYIKKCYIKKTDTWVEIIDSLLSDIIGE